MAELDFGEAPPRAGRREHDAYMTPPALANAIVSRVANAIVTSPVRIVEPACGDGDFVAPIRAMWNAAVVVAIDIRPETAERIKPLGAKFIHHDFLQIPASLLSTVDLILGNPPFSLFAEFVTHSISGLKPGAHLAFLLRLGHLAGSRRMQRWWTAPIAGKGSLPPCRQLLDVFPIHPRPSFSEDGRTDSQEYGVAIWKAGHDNGGRFDPIVWEKPSRNGVGP